MRERSTAFGGGSAEAIGSLGNRRGPDLPAPVVARAITVLALFCYSTVTVTNLFQWGGPTPLRVTVGIALAVIAFIVQFVFSAPSARLWGMRRAIVDTVLATALREGVTNALRHSKVQRCSISATIDDGTILLGIVNDGAQHHQASTRERPTSSGLDNLLQRLTEIGGRLTAELRDDGRFHLEACAPARPRTGDDEAPRDTGSRAGERTAA
ncbi:hypothetical protein [Streptomyces sp. NPDC127084]|uniref:hypothetical protein n=1 Tax=Streptomyces sp. NPDC127084 TaxID=3347133 RepID=UPI00364ED4FF